MIQRPLLVRIAEEQQRWHASQASWVASDLWVEEYILEFELLQVLMNDMSKRPDFFLQENVTTILYVPSVFILYTCSTSFLTDLQHSSSSDRKMGGVSCYSSSEKMQHNKGKKILFTLTCHWLRSVRSFRCITCLSDLLIVRMTSIVTGEACDQSECDSHMLKNTGIVAEKSSQLKWDPAHLCYGLEERCGSSSVQMNRLVHDKVVTFSCRTKTGLLDSVIAFFSWRSSNQVCALR